MAARERFRQVVAWVFVLGLLLGLGHLPEPVPATAQSGSEVRRIAGADRYGTAAAVSAATFAPQVDVAYVATGEDFADALAAGAAAADGGPVLLTRRDALPEATRAELARLRPARIVALGGDAAVGAGVEDGLASLASAGVERIAGADRYGTAAALSAATFQPGVDVVFVATGAGFADGLSASAAAAERGAPVLVVDPAGLPPAVGAELARLAPGGVVVVGGAQAVPDALLPDLAAAAGAPVRRVAGADRYATAAAVAADAFPAGAAAVVLASGAAFPDALAGAPAAAARGGPILLAEPGCVPSAVRAEVSRLTPARTLVLGGTAALAPAVERLTPCGGTPETSVLATGLDVPWDVAFTPDGRAFLTESDSGRILARNLDGTITEVQRLAVDPEGEGGLLGLAVSPTFADDGLLYAYLTTPEDNRIVRFRLGEAAEPILTGIPAGRIHNGGRIAFGPDGKLYAGTGEAGVPAHAQDPSSLGGKVLRLNADGSVPADNPLPGSPVYTLGHRNVQGLAWDAAGRLYITEFGPDRDDEINLLVPGGNYGWPEVTGTAGRPGFADPVAVRQPPEAAWSGATILQGGALPEYEGDLFAAGLRGQRLWRFALGPDGQVTGAEALFPGEFGRLRDVTQAPDGSLWILTDGDRLLRYGLQE